MSTFPIADRALLGPIYKQTDSKIILDSINQTLFRNISLSSETSHEEFYSALNNCHSSIQKVEHLWKYFELNIPNEIPLEDFQKNVTVSQELRERGNKYYKSKQFQKALRAYNLSLMFAPFQSIEMCLSYGNRSAIFLETKNDKNCREDIELATSCTNCPKDLSVRLNLRLQKLNEIQNSVSSKDSKVIDYRDNLIFSIKNPRTQAIADPARGRELVSNIDAKPGTVFLVEIPYVSVLKDELSWDILHCHYCLQKTNSCIPCAECIFATYCSEECKRKAFEEYHRFECKCLTLSHLLAEPRYAILAFRIICKLGPKNAYKLYKKKRKGESLSESNGCNQLQDYQQVCRLVSHADSHHDDIEKFSNIMQSLILCHCLIKFSNFFNDYNNDQQFAIWIASRILCHIEAIPYNSISLDEIFTIGLLESSSPDSDTIRQLKLDQFATGVYCNTSLLNHSCDPNVTRFNSRFGKVSIVSLKCIKPGQPLFTSYTKCFLTDSSEERHIYLKSTYNFVCKCKPCLKNWPTLETLLTEDMPKLIKSNKREFEVKCKLFYEAYQNVLGNKPLEAIQQIVPIIIYFQDNVKEPFSKTYMAQDILKRALDLIVYYSE